MERETSPEFRQRLRQYEDYKKAYTQALKKHEQQWKEYHEYPEVHPNYKLEWNKYWVDQSNKLRSQGLMVNDKDLTAEWAQIWSAREKVLEKVDTKIWKDKLFKRYRNCRTPSPSPPKRKPRIKVKKEKTKKPVNKVVKEHKPPVKEKDSDEPVINFNELHPVVKTCFHCVDQLCEVKDILGNLSKIVFELRKETRIMEATSPDSSLQLFSDDRIISGIRNLKTHLLKQMMSGTLEIETMAKVKKVDDLIVEMINSVLQIKKEK